jgi:UDP-glucose 4-epimerase
MQNVLVTGGARYIGSHACNALAWTGYHPVALDNLSLGHGDFVRGGPLVEADIHNTVTVAQTIEHYDIVTACGGGTIWRIHAYSALPRSYTNYGGYVGEHVVGR